MKNNDKDHIIQNLKSCIDYEKRKISKEKRQGITVNIQSRTEAIERMEKELDNLIVCE